MILAERHVESIRGILRTHLPDARVFLVGSRARGTAKPFSDVDLLIEDPPALEPIVRARLRVAFEESNLPYKVDLLEWSSVSPPLRAQLLECAEPLSLPQTR